MNCGSCSQISSSCNCPIYHIPLLKLPFFLPVKTTRNNSKTDRNKSAQNKLKSDEATYGFYQEYL